MDRLASITTTVPYMASNPGEHSGVSMSSHRPNELSTNDSLRILFWNINGLTQDIYTFNQVNLFKVLDKVPESDHRPLSISLSINYHCHNDKQIEEPEWQVTHKYIWHRDSLSQLPRIMCDERSQLFHDDLCDSISHLCDIDIVAGKLDLYISQACERAFSRTSCVRKHKKGPAWFDSECRLKRVTNIEQRQRQQDACRRYGACKQKKQRIYTINVLAILSLPSILTDQICGVLFSVSVMKIEW